MISLDGYALRYPDELPAMGRSLRHRGPDGRGLYQSPVAALGCERLRIVDCHERADQPFSDPEQRNHVVCNGEIYNAIDLRRRYGDYSYRSHSDVETLLPLYADKGAAGLTDLDGMFAIALWNERDQTLVLARDRAGEKPLFYTWVERELWFASEIQALLLAPGMSRDLDDVAVSQYLALGYVPEPRTMFRDIHKVEAGSIVQFSAQPGTTAGETVDRYWVPGELAAAGEPEGPAASRLRDLLREAVRKQATAEVPIGIFVSGGLDSSLLSVLAARQASGPFRTFAARFSERTYDESAWAAACARDLGFEHHEVRIDESSLGDALAAVVEGLAEPLADPAILPTYLLAREARSRQVKVILSGEGADELFGGYPTYLGHNLAPWVQALPASLRRLVRASIERLPASRGKVPLTFLLKRFMEDAEKPWFERHLAWFGTDAHAALDAHGGGDRPAPPPVTPLSGVDAASGPMLLDYLTYLRDNLLVKVDRATMLNSVEARAPFLDHELTAFALALPARLKVRGLTTKWLLKKTAREWLPKNVVYRRKRGLSVPVASWIDRGLRSEVDRLLAAERLARQELLDPRRVGRRLAEHRAGRANHARPLWGLVILQYWLERWVPERAG